MLTSLELKIAPKAPFKLKGYPKEILNPFLSSVFQSVLRLSLVTINGFFKLAIPRWRQKHNHGICAQIALFSPVIGR